MDRIPSVFGVELWHCEAVGNQPRAAEMLKPLRNAQQEAFCREHAAGASLRAAWMAAGFPETSRNWWRLAKRPHVVRRIEEWREYYGQTAAISLRGLQERLVDVANADIGQFLEPAPYSSGRIRVKDITTLPAEQRRAVQELTIDKSGKVTLKLESKSHAIDSLLKTVGAFAPSVVVNASAQAAAIAQAENMSAPDLVRRLSWAIESALAQTGEEGDGAAPGAHIEPNPPPALLPPRERARAAVLGAVDVARTLRGDPGELRWLADKLAEASTLVRGMVPA